jgi:hypothetical protein
MDNQNKVDTGDNSDNLNESPNLIDEPILNTVEKEPEHHLKFRVEKKRWQILRYIEANPNCTIYEISKQTDTNYSQAHKIMKEFEFCRLVAAKPGFNKFNGPCELFFIPIGDKK